MASNQGGKSASGANLAVTGAMNGPTLNVTGASNQVGNITGGANITAVGAMNGATVNTTGAANFSGAVTAGANVSVTGAMNSATINATGAANISGNITAGANIATTGAANSATITTTGNVTAGNDVNIGGAANVTGKLTGAIITDQNAYHVAGRIIGLCANTQLAFNWITPATTEQSLSRLNYDATYNNFATTDVITYGSTWVLSFYDGKNENLTVPDQAALSVADGGAGNNLTIVAWISVVASDSVQTVISKWDETSGAEAREWKLTLTAAERLTLDLYDESANNGVVCATNAALSAGWHFICITYDGTGGANAFDEANVVMYVDGVGVTDDETNNADYVAMENLTTVVCIGANENGAGVNHQHWQGDMGAIAFTINEPASTVVWQLYAGTRGFYTE